MKIVVVTSLLLVKILIRQDWLYSVFIYFAVTCNFSFK